LVAGFFDGSRATSKALSLLRGKKGSATIFPAPHFQPQKAMSMEKRGFAMEGMSMSRSLLLWTICLLIAVGRSNALDPWRQINQYGHAAWRIQDGTISAAGPIAQTTDGYIWIGTSDGLMRFDGVRFLPWTPPKGMSLPGRNFNFLLGARDGSLWIGTSGGLSHLKDGRFRNLTGSDGQYGISEIMEDHTGTIWVTRYRVPEGEGPLCNIAGEGLHCYGKTDGIPVRYGLGLTEDTSGNIWFGSTVLCRWSGGSFSSFFDQVLGKTPGGDGVISVKAGPNGTIWAGIDATGPQLGVQQFKDGKWSEVSVPGFKGSSIRAHALLMDRERSLWVGTSTGLYRIHDGWADHYGAGDGLSGDSVGTLFQDREGNLWVVTDGGVDMFRNTPVSTYTTRQGLTSSSIRSIIATRDGSVWIANEGGVDVLSAGVNHPLSVRHVLSGPDIHSFYEDHAGVLWLGLDKRLLTYEGDQFHEIKSVKVGGLTDISAIGEDTDHNIWAFGSERLFRIRDRQLRETVELSGEFRAKYGYLAGDPNGGIWFTTARTKLNHYHDGHFQNIPLPHTEPAATISGLVVDPDDPLLVPTSSGLFRWDNGHWAVLDTNNGLPCNHIFSIVKDRYSSLWLYAKCGLLRIEASDLSTWRQDPQSKVRVMTLDARDGAHPGMQNLAQPAAVGSVDGRLWFLNGMMAQSVDPDHLYKNPLPPPVHIGEIIADAKKYSAQNQLRLPAFTRDVQIDYTALSYSIPQKVHFRYQLEGHDETWQEADGRRQAFYTDLGPGKYRFRVVASNNDGVWNEQGAVLEFSVLPAWNQTNWFKLVVVASLILIIWAIYTLRVRQVAHALSVRFDERLAERTRIARDLHDTFLQTVQGSKMVADDALDAPHDAVRMRKALEQLSGWLKQAIDEGRAALNSLRTSATVTNDLADGLRRATEILSESHSMAVAMSVVGDAREMHPIVRDEVYRIGFEAIRNAQVHSRAGSLEVELRYGDNLELRVHDNGVGIDPAVTDHGKNSHFGLQGMRERAARIGGKLTILSSAASGTQVTLIVPGGTTFLHRGHGSQKAETTSSR
jgi:signal transduction histidine kinase/ligand-binding sensor domain-containing protein